MGNLKRKAKISSGLFISKEILEKTQIYNEDIEIELTEREIRIHSVEKERKDIFIEHSPLWDCIGIAEVKGINGREHDKYLYDEK